MATKKEIKNHNGNLVKPLINLETADSKRPDQSQKGFVGPKLV